MNVNKKILAILFLMLLLPIPVKGFGITIDWNNPVVAGYGTRKSWAEPKRDSSGNLYLCTQFSYAAGTTCSDTETALTDQVHAGIGVIASQNINYVCKEKLITKFLYHKLSQDGRTDVAIDTSVGTGSNGKPAARWANSCTNAQTIYDSAIAAYNNVVEFKKQKISYNKSKLDFIYNFDTQMYEAEVTVGNNVADYWCSADNDATVSWPSWYVTKVSISPENVVNDTTLTCWPRSYINKTKYYTCGSGYQALVTNSTTETAIWGDGAKITGKAKEFTINKVNSNGDKITSDTAKFAIYTDSNCTNALYESLETNELTGMLSIKLPPGTYYLKELKAPNVSFNNYIRDDSCKSIVVGTDSTSNYVNIENKTECEVLFEQDSSIVKRLEYYKAYGYRNLLNFDGVKDSATACSNIEIDYSPTESCLQTKQVNDTTLNNFNQGNLSNYNETISTTSTSGVSYCLTNFELIKKQEIKNGINAGQLVISASQNAPIVTGKVTKICYIHKDVIENYGRYSVDDFGGSYDYNKVIITSDGNYINYEDYVDSIEIKNIVYKPANKVMKFKNLVATRESASDEFYKIEKSLEVDYVVQPVYAYKISGRLPENQLEECINDKNEINPKCSILGYGVISQFKDGQIGNGSFNFKINKGKSDIFYFNNDNICEYEVNPEIIKYSRATGNLQLEFRIIDTTNPFKRTTNQNWSNGNDDSSNNINVQKYITNNNVNNSYNRTGNGSLYTNQTDGTKKIILTPDIIQKIRDYNNGEGNYADNPHPYTNYTNYIKKINNKEIVSTEFLDYIGIKKVD